MKQIPKVIQDVGFDFRWDNEKVWALKLPVEDMDIKQLEWHFDIPFWNKPDGGYYDLTPKEVLANPQFYKEEFERIMKSDLSHPLDVVHWKGRWLMLDGLHRLVKQKKLGKISVKVRKVPQDSISSIKK